MEANEYIDPDALSCITYYVGSKDPQDWLLQVQALADLYHWQEHTCVRIATLRLRGDAQRWARRCSFTSWADFCQQLQQRFGDTLEVAVTLLDNCYQLPDEQLRDFADRFLQLAAQAGRCEDSALVYSFTQRLLPDLSVEARRKRLHTIKDTIAYCEYWLSSEESANTCLIQELLPAPKESWLPWKDSYAPTNPAPTEVLSMMQLDAPDCKQQLLAAMKSLLSAQHAHLERMAEVERAQDREILALKSALHQLNLQQTPAQDTSHPHQACTLRHPKEHPLRRPELLSFVCVEAPASAVAKHGPPTHRYAGCPVRKPVRTSCDRSIYRRPSLPAATGADCAGIGVPAPCAWHHTDSLMAAGPTRPSALKSPNLHGHMTVHTGLTHNRVAAARKPPNLLNTCIKSVCLPSLAPHPGYPSTLVADITTCPTLPGKLQPPGVTNCNYLKDPATAQADYPTPAYEHNHMLAWCSVPKDPGK